MLQKLLHTREDYLLTLLRLALGVIFFAHGAQKVFGWWGGPGYSTAMTSFTQQMGIPFVFALLAIAAEFLGGIGLVFGLLTRIAAVGITSVMVVAIAMVHGQNGLFMAKNGFEFHLLAIAIALTLLARGAGAWSLDGLIEKGLTGSTVNRRYPTPLPHHH
jgi:putative oxidoreductase